MEPTRLPQVEQLYHAALEISPSERDAFLEKACLGDERLLQDVQSLIHHDEQARTVQVIANPSSTAGLEPGLLFEHKFRLVRKLGEGGMGQVWLTEQTFPVRRMVALKLIKAGMYDGAVIQRFQTERQSLAIMDHPTIAKVFDAGTTDQGQPYFVMEYVPGLPITAYCDQKKLTIKHRIELFIQACEGVQHAHQKAIIHRDLKPANILVIEIDGKPVPRIIDFGLAKATKTTSDGESLFTQVGQLIGTPAYMSPEQADSSRDIDTRTDVYSLGVVLYVLLTGELPLDTRQWQVQPLDMLRKLREEEPPSPSVKVSSDRGHSSAIAEARDTEPAQLASLLRGDLDWITLRALEKDRERRYASPYDLAADLRRHLSHEPVLARPASVGYRLRKYIRRNRVAVAVASTLIFLLAGFAAVQSSELRRITRERDRANRITDFMADMFNVSDPSEARGNKVTAREILDKASGGIETGLAKDPEAQAEMMHVMGRVYYGLGLYSRAETLMTRAIDIRRRVLGPENPDTLQSMSELVVILGGESQFPEEEKLARKILESRRRVLGPQHRDTLTSELRLADCLTSEGQYDESAKLVRDVIESRRKMLGPDHLDTLSAMQTLGTNLERVGRYSEATEIDRQLLESRRRVQGPDHPATMRVMSNLGWTLYREGRYAEAESYLREAVETARRVLGPEHPMTLGYTGRLATNVHAEGRLEEAEKLERGVLEVNRRLLGPAAYATIVDEGELARVLFDEGQYAEAETLLRTEVETGRQAYGPQYPEILRATADLGLILIHEGRAVEAEKLERETLDAERRVLGPEHLFTTVAETDLADALIKQGLYAEAETLARQTLDIQLRVFGRQHADTLSSLQSLGIALARQHRYEEAKKLFSDTILQLSHNPDVNLPLAWYSYACVAAAANDREAAIHHLREAVSRAPQLAAQMGHDDNLKFLRGDPLFQALLANAQKPSTATALR